MKIIKISTVLMIGLATIFVSCDNKKKEEIARQRNIEISMLQSKLTDYQSTRSSLNFDINNEKTKLSDYNRSKFQMETKLNNYEDRVEAYLMNHKMAVACIVGGLGGASVSFDTTSEFSNEMKDVANVVTAISALYAILNLSEVVEVADVIEQADNNVKRMKNQIKRAKSLIRTTEMAINTKKSRLNSLNSTIVYTRNRIEKLKI